MNEKQILKFGIDWDKAMLSNDAEEISRFMSDDWVIVGTEGGITNKETFLNWIRSGAVVHTRMDSDEIRIRIYEKTGIVISRGTSAGLYNGKPFELYEWSTSVVVSNNNAIQCVATMLTKANP